MSDSRRHRYSDVGGGYPGYSYPVFTCAQSNYAPFVLNGTWIDPVSGRALQNAPENRVMVNALTGQSIVVQQPVMQPAYQPPSQLLQQHFNYTAQMPASQQNVQTPPTQSAPPPPNQLVYETPDAIYVKGVEYRPPRGKRTITIESDKVLLEVINGNGALWSMYVNL